MLQIHISSYRHSEHSLPMFQNMDFTLQPGKVYVMLGLSGVGKTTLMNILVSLHQGRLCGSVKYSMNGSQHDALKMRNIGQMGVLTQQTSLIPWLKVNANLLLPSRLNSHLLPPDDARLCAAVKQLGLTEGVLSHFPHELSGGMQRRVVFARMLLYRPLCLFMDEVFSGLDTFTSDLISDAIREHVSDVGGICLVITHEVEKALSLGDHIYFLSRSGDLKNIPKTITKEAIIELFDDDYRLEEQMLIKTSIKNNRRITTCV